MFFMNLSKYKIKYEELSNKRKYIVGIFFYGFLACATLSHIFRYFEQQIEIPIGSVFVLPMLCILGFFIKQLPSYFYFVLYYLPYFVILANSFSLFFDYHSYFPSEIILLNIQIAISFMAISAHHIRKPMF